VIEGPNRGWTSAPVLVALVVGAIVIALFVGHELRTPSPLFDVRILRRPVVATGSITLFIAYLLFTGFLFVLPQYLQDVEAESIVTVGLLLVPFAVVFGLCSTRAASALERFGSRVTIASGLVVSAVAAALLALTVGGPIVFTILATMVLGAGISMLIAPPSTVVMNDLPEAKAGDGSSLNMVSRFVGAAVGVAIVGSVLASAYARDISHAVASLDPAQTDQAQGSIQGALEVAQTLPASAGTALVDAARDAFNRGATAAYLVIAAMAAFAAAWAWFALRRNTDERVLSDEEGDSRVSR
jgi:predicted MFS family arabinose efflux permease